MKIALAFVLNKWQYADSLYVALCHILIMENTNESITY